MAKSTIPLALDRSAFLREAKVLFPELRDKLNSQYGLLHCEMHEFGDFVQKLVDAQDKARVLKAFQFAERIGRHGNTDLVNALGVSFLEHLNLSDEKTIRSWARALMPPLVAEIHAAVQAYHSNARAKQPYVIGAKNMGEK